VARDVTASGGLLAAVVGGSVLSPTSPDRGGSLMLVSGGGPVQIGDSSVLFRRPALSPSGDRLVVSALTSSANPDLWLFDFR
jgi:hypothetical protein